MDYAFGVCICKDDCVGVQKRKRDEAAAKKGQSSADAVKSAKSASGSRKETAVKNVFLAQNKESTQVQPVRKKQKTQVTNEFEF
jgi:hypothetical protein